MVGLLLWPRVLCESRELSRGPPGRRRYGQRGRCRTELLSGRAGEQAPGLSVIEKRPAGRCRLDLCHSLADCCALALDVRVESRRPLNLRRWGGLLGRLAAVPAGASASTDAVLVGHEHFSSSIGSFDSLLVGRSGTTAGAGALALPCLRGAAHLIRWSETATDRRPSRSPRELRR